MSKLDCDVIKDLIPSYLDHISSKTSSELVEEHVKECDVCREYLTTLQGTELIGEQTQQKELDYLKKVKKHIASRNMIIYSILVLVVVIGMAAIISNFGKTPLKLFYVIMFLMMDGTAALMSDVSFQVKKDRYQIIMTGVILLLTIATIVLEVLCVKWVSKGTYPLGMILSDLGPFLYRCFMTIAILLLGIYLFTVWRSIKESTNYMIIANLSLLGSCIALIFISILKATTSIEELYALRSNALLLILAEGIITIALLYILNKRRFKQEEV